jgi:carbonic anhydrase
VIPAAEALALLREGNARFAAGRSDQDASLSHAQRAELATGQRPFAIVLGCSDSRVPVEMVFDQGLGDLFVVRVAGNIVAPSQLASVEFAATKFDTRLVVVLGHSQCGAIQGTLDELRLAPEERSRNLRALVARIQPSVEGLLETELRHDPEALVERAVRENVAVSVESLRHGSEVLEQLIRDEGLQVVGAEYCLERGVVEFLDAPGDTTQRGQ